MKPKPNENTTFTAKLTKKLSTTLNYFSSFLIHSEEYTKPFTEKTYYEGYLEGRRAAEDDLEKYPDKRPHSPVTGLSKEQYLKYAKILYNNLVIGDFFYFDKKLHLRNYKKMLYRIRHQIENLQMHDRKLENERQDLLKRMNDRIKLFENTDDATLIISFMKGEEAIEVTESIAQDALEWGKLIGYANGFLYAYEKFGHERFELASAELMSLEHRFAKHHIPPDTAMTKEDFLQVRSALLNRIRQYIFDGIVTSENPHAYETYKFTRALWEKEDPYDSWPEGSSNNPFIYRLQHGNLPPDLAPPTEVPPTEIL